MVCIVVAVAPALVGVLTHHVALGEAVAEIAQNHCALHHGSAVLQLQGGDLGMWSSEVGERLGSDTSMKRLEVDLLHNDRAELADVKERIHALAERALWREPRTNGGGNTRHVKT